MSENKNKSKSYRRMKVQKVSQSVSSFAGISFVHEEFNNCGLLQHIDRQPGKRDTSGYRHGELFRTWFEIFFCEGEVAEDVHEHLRSTSESIPGNRVAAPDTLLRELKGWTTEDTIVTSSSGKEYRFNINDGKSRDQLQDIRSSVHSL